jgi:hypothetical protein
VADDLAKIFKPHTPGGMKVETSAPTGVGNLAINTVDEEAV